MQMLKMEKQNKTTGANDLKGRQVAFPLKVQGTTKVKDNQLARARRVMEDLGSRLGLIESETMLETLVLGKFIPP